MQHIVKALSKTIGLANTLELCARWGGRELSVPTVIKTRLHPIALIIGLDDAIKLTKQFGGQRLRLPMEKNALLELRNRMIAQEVENGDSLTKVANRYGLSRCSVKSIYSHMKFRNEIGLAGINIGEDNKQSLSIDPQSANWEPQREVNEQHNEQVRINAKLEAKAQESERMAQKIQRMTEKLDTREQEIRDLLADHSAERDLRLIRDDRDKLIQKDPKGGEFL